jgi:hypothetical protein
MFCECCSNTCGRNRNIYFTPFITLIKVLLTTVWSLSTDPSRKQRLPGLQSSKVNIIKSNAAFLFFIEHFYVLLFLNSFIFIVENMRGFIRRWFWQIEILIFHAIKTKNIFYIEHCQTLSCFRSLCSHD